MGREQKMPKKSKRESDFRDLVALHHRKSPATESFRTIRTNLQYMSPDKELKVIMITGSEQGIGKSTIASNLALTFEMNGDKTFIIDTDMRKPVIHKLFNIPNFKGLSTYLSGEEKNIEGVINHFNQKELYIIPSGPVPPNPSELLNSKKMQKVLDFARKEADMVIIDAPPLLPVTDSVLLSQRVDGVIMTAMTNQTKKEVFKKGVQRLKQVNANLLGSVLNKYPVKGSQYYNYQNYYYYGHE
jgi:capsular exopolysaccharide synthesis family protein